MKYILGSIALFVIMGGLLVASEVRKAEKRDEDE